MKRKWFAWIMVLSLLLGGCAAAMPEEETPPETTLASPTEETAPANIAPDFTVYDLAGNPVKLSDFRGKPVVLNFWASWCGPCKHEMPDFDEAYAEFGADIHFVMVNLTDGSSETVDSAHGYVQGQGYAFPVYYDTTLDAANTYGVYSIPTTYFIDAKGQLVAQARGAIDGETLRKGIAMILE